MKVSVCAAVFAELGPALTDWPFTAVDAPSHELTFAMLANALSDSRRAEDPHETARQGDVCAIFLMFSGHARHLVFSRRNAISRLFRFFGKKKKGLKFDVLGFRDLCLFDVS